MEAVGLASSLLGVASLAVGLTQNLYRFGATAAGARQQIHRIARNLAMYSSVLDMLMEHLKDQNCTYPQRALDFAKQVEDDSRDFLERIERLLPSRQRYRDDLSFQQKITWNFKKTRVDILIAELERLKSTVQIFIGILSLGREYRSYRRKRTSRRRWHSVRVAFVRVQNILVEHRDTSDELSMLQAQQSQLGDDDVPEGPRLTNGNRELSTSGQALVRTKQGALELLRGASGPLFNNPRYDATAVLSHTAEWALKLLREWSSISPPPVYDDEDPYDDPLQEHGMPQYPLVTTGDDAEENLALDRAGLQLSGLMDRIPSLTVSGDAHPRTSAESVYIGELRREARPRDRNDSRIANQPSRQAHVEDEEEDEPKNSTPSNLEQQTWWTAPASTVYPSNTRQPPSLQEPQRSTEIPNGYGVFPMQNYGDFRQPPVARPAQQNGLSDTAPYQNYQQPGPFTGFLPHMNYNVPQQITNSSAMKSNTTNLPLYVGHYDEKTKSWHRFVGKDTSQPVTLYHAYMTSPQSYEMVPDPAGPPKMRKQGQSKDGWGKSKTTSKGWETSWWDPLGGPSQLSAEEKKQKSKKPRGKT